MRLEPFCRISMRYADGSWHRPYGAGGESEGLGFGQGEGTISGEIDEEVEEWWLDAFVCVNDVAQGPPALGAEAPERFRA
jgi:hypothetical protein